MALQMVWWGLELGQERQEPWGSTKLGPRLPAVTLASAHMGRSDILQLSSCSLPSSPFSSDVHCLTLCQVDLSVLGNFFPPFGRIIFCHISELNQVAEAVPCLGVTTDSLSHAAVPTLIGNAREGNMSKMLSPGRSSDSYFWETRIRSLKKVWFFFVLGL